MERIRTWLRVHFARRPGWMNAVMVFCAFATVIYVPWDFFVKAVAEDQEAWFGFLLTGYWAKATEPLHWLQYVCLECHGAYHPHRNFKAFAPRKKKLWWELSAAEASAGMR